ncbi:hypothetical protein CMEL01_12480 [Colletotrichum melonis]|uniref:Uncharacterized protein n=1 Tax=Colletotrichum melonis TaxID=1209925 RepID=A0AAI9UX67_9PEZI|nr:hypothetical protein CMEL01_12480 [Colletotrichum melonis]
MKTSIAYIIAAALFGATQAAITPMNNIIRHEYNLNARAGVHGNIERDEPAVAPEGDTCDLGYSDEEFRRRLR